MMLFEKKTLTHKSSQRCVIFTRFHKYLCICLWVCVSLRIYVKSLQVCVRQSVNVHHDQNKSAWFLGCVCVFVYVDDIAVKDLQMCKILI